MAREEPLLGYMSKDELLDLLIYLGLNADSKKVEKYKKNVRGKTK